MTPIAATTDAGANRTPKPAPATGGAAARLGADRPAAKHASSNVDVSTRFDQPVHEPTTPADRLAALARRHQSEAASQANAAHDATYTGTGSTPGATDGAGIRRGARNSTYLVLQQPELLGKLVPPTAPPPKGVQVRTEGDGTRVVTINVHEGVPGGIDMDDDSNESIDGLRDIARYINSIDPDVVLVQELTRHKSGTKPEGVEEQPSVLAHLMQADDVAFGPAFTVDHGATETGTAIFTRNGYTIDHAVNARLPDGDATQPRGTVVAEVVPPSGSEDAFTVIGTHLAHIKADTASRAKELATITGIVNGIQHHGSFRYERREQPDNFWTRTFPGIFGHHAMSTGAGFPTKRIVFGGDLNAEQDEVDAGMNGSGLEHVIAELKRAPDAATRAKGSEADVNTTARRIDHIYTYGFTPTDADVAAVENHDLPDASNPTDHKGFITQLEVTRAATGSRNIAR
ncbi:MAG: hypothetical protein H7287_02710 [Thermoleophilia bacterium]|nr:hypothetical protein [Thermoleophilia bacterium]